MRGSLRLSAKGPVALWRPDGQPMRLLCSRTAYQCSSRDNYESQPNHCRSGDNHHSSDSRDNQWCSRAKHNSRDSNDLLPHSGH
mmetsp:Transcript_35816/g.64731  ORF Transcript_35816/g.64731 Transcript_35816/m.64731 type:complete len:84 (-) Transcript_35816:183-434(-)